MNRRDFMGGLVAAGVVLQTGSIKGLLPEATGETLCGTGVEVLDRLYPRYFDRQGLDMTMWEWAERMENIGYKRIALTYLPNDRYVSTVWFGLDHSFSFKKAHRPLIFETMAFRSEASYAHPFTFGDQKHRGFIYHEEVDCERWSTEIEALEGHRQMCEKVCPGSLTLGLRREYENTD